MKALLFIAVLLTAAISHADHYDNETQISCRVVKMYDYTYFEEALSKDEYPDIELAKDATGDYSIQFGSNQPNEKAQGDTITVSAEKYKGIQVNVVTPYNDVIRLETEARKTLALGKVKVKENGKSRAKTIAEVVCDKGIL